MTPTTLLVADDEVHVRKILVRSLGEKGYRVLEAADGEEAWACLQREPIALALVDIKMPRLSGLDLLDRVRKMTSPALVIVLTAFDSMQNAVEAMKRGAFDYLPKPFDLDQLEIQVRKALETRALREEVENLRQELKGREGRPGELVGTSRGMGEIYKTIGRVAPSDVTVLITGESGTGKELIARAIHAASRRASRPFTTVNCAAIPRELLESELFGHSRGAFTGAVEAKKGLIEAAERGTLFLDEIGDMPLELQAKILRVLQEREIQRIGETNTLPIDVRIIAATHQDLARLVREGRFREDLYFRLNVVQIRVPSLRERKEDIPALSRHLLDLVSREFNLPAKTLAPQALATLLARPWPGNVRQLANCLKQSALLSPEGVIQKEAVDRFFHDQEDGLMPAGMGELALEEVIRWKLKQYLDRLGRYDPEGLYETILKQLERPLLELILSRTRGHQIRAAKILGLNRNTLRKKIRDLGLSVSRLKKELKS